MARVRKAVFPVAGMGTRFLPATKASPKEMLPVIDKPLIQYAVSPVSVNHVCIFLCVERLFHIYLDGRAFRSGRS